MPRVADLLREKRTFSFEFTPPRDDAAQRRLEKALLKLERLQPDFTSVTYGALGSTKDKTWEIVEHIHHNTSMPVMPHLTCVGHTRAQIEQIVGGYRDMGIENLLALGGDPPADGHPVADDFHFAAELIDAVREIGDFCIGVAAFPELHPRSPDRETDRRHLAAKLRLADFAITQFGFAPDDYFRMVDELAALGVDTPVIPGVMLFTNVDGLRRMARLNNAAIPADLDAALDRVAGDPTETRKLAVEWGTRIAAELLERGVPGIHFYTMNASHATLDLYEKLGLTPTAP
ncbi:MAG TPA: methylenetetrahydrofolate reductase [Acidimicrobiales bacterium]|nr:methylenetetrahydrofolate reductase [Acidimicrobiales bacterium]